MSNSLFLHRNNFNHAIDWDNSKVLLNCNNVTRKNIIEFAVIKYQQNLMNVSQGLYELDDLIVSQIFKLVSV